MEAIDKSAEWKTAGAEADATIVIREDLIANAVFVSPSSISIQFHDGRRFDLPIDKIPIDTARVNWSTAAATESGEQMMVLGFKGDTVPIDAGTLRCLVDEQFAETIRASLNQLRRTRAERRESLKDMPPAPTWVFEPSPDMRRDSWK